MLRHTVDYDNCEADWRTETGIADNDEEMGEDEENQKGNVSETGSEHVADDDQNEMHIM